LTGFQSSNQNAFCNAGLTHAPPPEPSDKKLRTNEAKNPSKIWNS